MSERTLIDKLLEEQQQLTAVERFARQHETGTLPAQSRYYHSLLPLQKPQAGQQYAFGVDLDACTGCKACVSACHSLNGLEDDEIWRNVGIIHGTDEEEGYQQTVTTACHHCVDPACLNGCPVKAYDKDPETGIVRHLDDQCIGCQYCVLKCPYDVPKYSKKRGIVRKCDMCSQRLGVGEAPACVQACPNEAISIRLVDRQELAAAFKPGDRLLPDTFDSNYTKPSTVYVTRKSIPANARSGDAHALRLEHAHFPLIFMLILTQIATGVFLGLNRYGSSSHISLALTFTGWMILQLGLAVSVLHLGRPLGAWRAFLGLRTSWMSREILAFSLFAGAASASLGVQSWNLIIDWFPIVGQLPTPPPTLLAPLRICTAIFGLLGVYCSGMIYIDTRRSFWIRELTFPKFFGTTALLGSGTCAAVMAWMQIAGEPVPSGSVAEAALLALFIRTTLFGWEIQNLRQLLRNPANQNHRSALTVWTLQRPLVLTRAGLFFSATVLSIFGLSSAGILSALCLSAALGLTALSQTIERYFYFTAVVAPRMPGGIAT